MFILGLAPMDGITDSAFREITKNIRNKYWDKTQYRFFLRTEFMNADGYCKNPQGVIKHLLTTASQSPIIAQVFWWNEKTLIQCFKDLEKKYSDYFYWLELNLWCPARNVMQTGWWSAMLKDKKRTLEIIKKIRKAIKMPFSIKTRTGINQEDKSQQMKFLIQVSKYVDMISIHGRTVKAWYWWEADRDFIYELKAKLKNSNCKIIWNWWIKFYTKLSSFYKGGGWKPEDFLDGIMIGKATIGNPRIFTPHIPNKKELRETIIQHLNLMINHEIQFQKNITNLAYRQAGLKKVWNIWKISILLSSSWINQTFQRSNVLRPVIEFRKHLFQYVKWIPWSKQRKQKIAKIENYDQLIKEINKFLK